MSINQPPVGSPRYRTRKALLTADKTLSRERGFYDLTFDEIAVQAQVSRRTIFNHFPTRDDLVVALCEDSIVDVVNELTSELQSAPIGERTVADFFAALNSALAAVNLPAAIERIASLMQPGDRPTHRADLITTALSVVGTLVHDETRRRLPNLNSLQVDLFASAMINGLCVIAETWFVDFEGDPDRTKWSSMLTTLMSSLERGYAHSV